MRRFKLPPADILASLLAVLVVTGTGCPGRVEVTPDAATIRVGETVALQATVGDVDRSVIWRSTRTNVATVDADGVVLGVAPGTATIIARAGLRTDRALITVEEGGTTVTVPDVVNFTQSEAEATITGAGLTVGTVTEESSNTVTEGYVIRQDPEEGTSVDSGTAINLVVSTGSGLSVDFSAVRVTPDFGNAASREAEGWAAIEPFMVTTSGNPQLGGHGATGTPPPLTMKAAYDDENLYMYFEWEDDSANETDRKVIFSEASGTWTTGPDDEDRLYVMWPIVDGAGREGATFAERGCAVTCHALSVTTPVSFVAEDASVPVETCSSCHNSPNEVVGQTPPFQHPVVPEGFGCDVCHADYSEPPADGLSEGGDMVAVTDTAYDIWHWKANRSNPLGVVDDQFTANGVPRGSDGPGLTTTNILEGRPLYVWADGTASDSVILQSMIDAASDRLAGWNGEAGQYENLATSEVYMPFDGQDASLYILQDGRVADGVPTANTKADAIHNGSQWTVVLSRSLFSGDPDKDVAGMTLKTDADIDTGAPVLFSVATTNNSGGNHQGFTGPVTMGFLP